MVEFIDQVTTALNQALVQPFINVVPWLIVSAVIIIIFWLISKVIKRAVVQIMQSLGTDKWIEEHKIATAIGGKKVSEIIGSLTKWYFIWVGLYVVAKYIKLEGLSDFLGAVVYYVPRALAGVLFFVLALLLAKYITNQILAVDHKLKTIAAALVQAVIVIFAIVISLQMVLGNEIGQTLLQLLQIFIQPFVIALAIVFGIVAGLAAGFGFKEEISKFAKDVKKEYFK